MGGFGQCGCAELNLSRLGGVVDPPGVGGSRLHIDSERCRNTVSRKVLGFERLGTFTVCATVSDLGLSDATPLVPHRTLTDQESRARSQLCQIIIPIH